MYNSEIYKRLDDKFGPFNMLLISQAFTEMYRLIYEEEKNKEAHFEWLWWQKAEENASKTIDQ